MTQMTQMTSVDRLCAAVNRLFVSKEYSDFTIICNGRRYHLHKSIVCTQSDVFAVQLRSKFREGQENSIDLSESDAAVVHCMLRYFYGFDYSANDQFDESGFEYFGEGSAVPQRPSCIDPEEPAAAAAKPEPEPAEVVDTSFFPAVDIRIPSDPAEEATSSQSNGVHINLPMHSFMLHTKVYIIAEMYGIPGLKSAALLKFDTAKALEWDMNEFILAAEVAYNWTRAADFKLRESIVKGFKDHKSVLTDDKWKPALIDMGYMMYDIARSLAEDMDVRAVKKLPKNPMSGWRRQ